MREIEFQQLFHAETGLSPAVYHVWDDPTYVSFVMEQADTSLDVIVSKIPAIDFPNFVDRLITFITKIFCELARTDLFHGDIHLGNIATQDGRLMLLDFGYASKGANLLRDFLKMLQYFRIDVYLDEFPDQDDIYDNVPEHPKQIYTRLLALYAEWFPHMPSISLETTHEEIAVMWDSAKNTQIKTL